MFAGRNMMFASAAFSPLSLSPLFWVSDEGSDPSLWADLSGGARHWYQSTASMQPAIVSGAKNGRQVRRFDGINDFMEWPVINLRTVFFVYRRNGAHPTYSTLFGQTIGSSAYGQYFISPSNTWCDPTFSLVGWRTGVWRKNGIEFNPLAANSDPLSEWAVVSVVTSAAVPAAQTRDREVLSRVPNCDLGEVIAMDRVATANEITAVERYLNAKWAIY